MSGFSGRFSTATPVTRHTVGLKSPVGGRVAEKENVLAPFPVDHYSLNRILGSALSRLLGFVSGDGSEWRHSNRGLLPTPGRGSTEMAIRQINK